MARISSDTAEVIISGVDQTGPATKSSKENFEKATNDMIASAKKLGLETRAELDIMKAKYAESFEAIKRSGILTTNELIAAEKQFRAIQSANSVTHVNQITNAHLQAEKAVISGNMSMSASFAALNAAALPIIATIGSMAGAWNMAKMAADVQSQEQILANLGVQYGMTATQIVNAMKEASGGILSTVDTIDVATRGLMSGLNVDQIVSVAGMAASIADATGKADADVISILEKTIATGESRGLKTLTLSADFQKAHEQYAASIHKTVAALTLQERQAANMIAVQEMYNKQIKNTEYGLTFANDSMKRINNQMQDTQIILGKIAYSVGGVFVAMIQSFIGAIEGYIARGLEHITVFVEHFALVAAKIPGGQIFGDIAHNLRTMTETMKDAQTQSNEYAQEAFRLTASLWNETKGHADNRKAIEEETQAKIDSQKAYDDHAAQIVSITNTYLQALSATQSVEEQQVQKQQEMYQKLLLVYDEKTAKVLSNNLIEAQSAQKLNNELTAVSKSMYGTFQQQYAATKSIGAAMEAAIRQAVAAKINAYGAEAAVAAGMEFAAAWGSLATYQPVAAAQHTAAGIGYLGVAAIAGVGASIVAGGGGGGSAPAPAGGGFNDRSLQSQQQQEQKPSSTLVIDTQGLNLISRDGVITIIKEINKAVKEKGYSLDGVSYI